MDNFGSNYAFQQDDELVLQNRIPSLACELQTIPEDSVINYSSASLDLLDGDYLAVNSSLGGSNLTINEKGKRQRKSSSFPDGDENTSDDKQKKIIHRDNERQRRQKMADLYASLRMQLPQEFTMEKRSVSDLIDEAANYVKHKENNIEGLKAKRDTLKNLTSANDLNSTNQSSSCSYQPIDVTVGSFLGGIEILIGVDLRMDTFSLSRVLEVVLAKGLSIVSCFCSKANGRILHTIKTEVGHLGGVDAYELQQELTNIVNTT